MIKRSIIQKAIVLSVPLAFWAPLFVYAQTNALPGKLVSLIQKAESWFLTIIVSLSVIMILVAAFNYVTAGGDKDKVSSANKFIIFACVGLAVALLAKAIVGLVCNFTGSTTCL